MLICFLFYSDDGGGIEMQVLGTNDIPEKLSDNINNRTNGNIDISQTNSMISIDLPSNNTMGKFLSCVFELYFNFLSESCDGLCHSY